MFKLELKENRQARSICETKSRYDLFHNGVKVGQLYWNMTGYTGAYLPLPEGGVLDIGERGISTYRREIAKLNRRGK